MMYMRFADLAWAGAGLYTFMLPEDATVIDCFCSSNFLKLGYLDVDQFPVGVQKARHFKVVGDWENGILLEENMAYVGLVHWQPVSHPTTVTLSVGGTNVDLLASELGQKIVPEIETYVVFENLSP
jgi:hypothetical protein